MSRTERPDTKNSTSVEPELVSHPECQACVGIAQKLRSSEFLVESLCNLHFIKRQESVWNLPSGTRAELKLPQRLTEADIASLRAAVDLLEVSSGAGKAVTS